MIRLLIIIGGDFFFLLFIHIQNTLVTCAAIMGPLEAKSLMSQSGRY